MKERLRGFLGFLGLVEDDYGDLGPNGAPRPFSEQPETYEPEWSAPTLAPRSLPPHAAPTSFRVTASERDPLRAAPSGRRPTSISVLEGGGGTARVRPIANPNAARTASTFAAERDVAVVSPDTYDDSRRITDHLRANRPVVLATLDADPGLARRLVDFTAGTAYALNAKIEMLVRGVYLISPQGTYVGPELKERLRAANYRTWDEA
jgi:FtsZ-interacting cell division protein YlmF